MNMSTIRPIFLNDIACTVAANFRASVSSDIFPEDGGAEAVEEEEEDEAPARTTLPLPPAAAVPR